MIIMLMHRHDTEHDADIDGDLGFWREEMLVLPEILEKGCDDSASII